MRGSRALVVTTSIALVSTIAGCGGAESYVRTPVRADSATWNSIIANGQLMSCSAKGPDPVSGLVLECEDGGKIVFGRDQGDDARIIDDPQHYLLEGRCYGSAAKFCGALVGQLVGGQAGAPTPTAPPATPTAPPVDNTTGDAELKPCMPGKLLSDCAKALKAKTPPVEDLNFAFLPQFGLEFKMEDDQRTIRGLFLHFFSKTEGAYKKSFRGIDKNSTETDIFAEFGHPIDVSDSVVSQYGEYPGAQEHAILYDDYRFTFYDGKLAIVAIFTKPQP